MKLFGIFLAIVLGFVLLCTAAPEPYYTEQKFDATLLEKWEDWSENKTHHYYGLFAVQTDRGLLERERPLSARHFANTKAGDKFTITDSFKGLDAPPHTYTEANFGVWLFIYGVLGLGVFMGCLWFWLNDEL